MYKCRQVTYEIIICRNDITVICDFFCCKQNSLRHGRRSKESIYYELINEQR